MRRTEGLGLPEYKALIGQITMTWSSTHVTWEIDGATLSGSYSVLAKDEVSAVVKIGDWPFGELQQIRFDGSHYGVIAGSIIEWFRKLDD
jgi:hypothetical protein